MTPEEIATILARRVPDPDQVIFVVTMVDVLKSIAGRLEKDALSLTATELLAARDDVRAVFSHYLHERDLMNLGLETWMVARSL